MQPRTAPSLTILLALLALPVRPARSQTLPSTPKVEAADTHFGRVVADPYRWMEKPAAENAPFRQWLERQNGYTRSVLDRIPGRSTLTERIRSLSDAGTSVAELAIGGTRWFYLKTEPGVESRRLYVREGPAGRERVLVDPNLLHAEAGSHYSIDYLFPSLDGRLLAYGLSLGGSERTVLHILDAGTGKQLPDSITRAQYAALSWRPDNRSFFYNRLSAAGESNPAERYLMSRVYLHVVGKDASEDVEWLGNGTSSGVTVAPEDFPVIAEVPGAPYLFAMVWHGVQPEVTLYVAPGGVSRGARTPWKKVGDESDAITGFAPHGEDLYLLTHKGASRFKVIRTRSANPDLRQADVVVPAGQSVVQKIGVARDALYLQDLDGGIARIRRVPFGGGRAQSVALPFEGSIPFFVTDPRLPGAVFRLQSWTRSPRWFAYDPRNRSVGDTRLVAPSPVDFSGIESVETQAPAPDGTMVPLSIIYPKGLARDGSHPTLLDGYGSYGITLDPFFSPLLLAWLEKGGVYAVAHVRGGGEYGEDWHQAGKETTKPNTWKDFIACAEYLVHQGFTSPAHLAGSGASAGGITIGRAITERPDLFRAAVPMVGVLNALRTEQEPGGPANIPEFGTVRDSAGFRALLEMDALSHVKPGVRYPATLLTAGIFDSRVEAWQPGKMTAALQEASTSGYPVLLRVDFDAGHGMGLNKSQWTAEWADIYGFLLWQLGHKEFQITP